MGLRRFLRKVIPREIREPISDVTESLEDAVRPVTDPARKFLSKAVPKEIKGILGSSAAIALGATAGGPIGAFITAAIADALAQKALTDPDAEDTGVSLESAILSGIGGSLAQTAKIPKTTKPTDSITRDFDIAEQMAKPIGERGTFNTATQPAEFLQAADGSVYLNPDVTPKPTGAGIVPEKSNVITQAIQKSGEYLTPPSLDNTLGDFAKESAQYASAMGTLRSPLTIQDIVEEEEAKDAALAASEAATKANYDELQKQRVASMLGSFERAGFEPEETQREIEEEGLTVSLADVQDYFNKVRQFVAKGGRIGFSDGSRGDLKAAVESFIRDFPQFEDLEGVELYKKMEEKGYLSDRDELSQGGRIGFQDGSQEGPMTMGMGIGRYIEEERIRRKMLDRIKRMMNEKAFNMQQDLPGPVMRNLNMLNPFDKDPTGEQEIFDMKNRYMDTMDAMRDQGIERAKEMNKMLEKFMPAPKQDFESYVNMIDKNFPARNNTEGRQFANQGGRMTPEGDPISPDVPPGMQMDLRGGGFIPLGTKPRADDVPAMVGKNEFVLNDRAVSGIGKMITGNPDPRAGARALYELQENMEAIV